MSYNQIKHLTSVGRIRKLLNLAKENKIILLQGRLDKAEEAELIQATMEEINKNFKGIELAVIQPRTNNNKGLLKLKNTVVSYLLGNQQGMTVIGSASVVKSIKRDPHKIELLMRNKRKRKR
jgi:hypothetical protein